MIIVYRAIKKWSEMSAAEMLHALKNQHYYDPQERDLSVDSAATFGNLDRGVHKGEVNVMSGDYGMILLNREEQYRQKCNEEGITPEELPKWER